MANLIQSGMDQRITIDSHQDGVLITIDIPDYELTPMSVTPVEEGRALLIRVGRPEAPEIEEQVELPFCTDAGSTTAKYKNPFLRISSKPSAASS